MTNYSKTPAGRFFAYRAAHEWNTRTSGGKHETPADKAARERVESAFGPIAAGIAALQSRLAALAATPDEYATLRAELEAAPFHYRLRVILRTSPAHLEARKAALRRLEAQTDA